MAEVDRPALLKAFRAFHLKANELTPTGKSVSRADNAMLVNALSMMAPLRAGGKAGAAGGPDLKVCAETLIAITEMVLARENEDFARACNSVWPFAAALAGGGSRTLVEMAGKARRERAHGRPEAAGASGLPG